MKPNDLISFFVYHRTAANLGILAIVIIGLVSLFALERETFPDTSSSSVVVSVAYSGAAPNDVDEEICKPLSDVYKGISYVENSSCTAVTGSATAYLTMADGGDLNQFFNDISTATARADLPTEAESPSIYIGARGDLVAILAVTGLPTTQDLAAYAHELARKVGDLEGVSRTSIGGLSQSKLKITYNDEALRFYGISPQQVSDILSSRSMQKPIGSLTTDNEIFYLRYDDVRRSVDDLYKLVVTENANGGQVKLGDIARVDFVEDREEVRTELNGERAVTLRVNKNSEDDAIKVFGELNTFLNLERQRFPEPFDIVIYRDRTSFVNDRIQTVSNNMIQGLIMVLLVMTAFFSFREAFWISFTLPVSMLGGVALMYFFGVSINMISLVALLMAVGLIMDDSIVIADNIARHRRLSKTSFQAAVDGSKEVFSGVISSFLTTACVFGPLIFIEGRIGKILGVIPLVLLMVLSLSIIEAFLMLPHHLTNIRTGVTRNRPANRLFETAKARYVLPAVRYLTRWRYLTLGSVFGLLAVSITMVMSGYVSVVFFPRIDGDNIEARVSMVPGTSLAESQVAAAQITDALEQINEQLSLENPDGQPLIERVVVSYADNPDVSDQGPHTFTVEARLLGAEIRAFSLNQVLRAWKKAVGSIPNLLLINFSRGGFGAGGADIDQEVYGADKDTVLAAANAYVTALSAQKGVVSVFNNFSMGAREIQLKLLPEAYTLGLTPKIVVNQLRTALNGVNIDRFSSGDLSVDVSVSLDDSLANLTAFENFPIVIGGGRTVALDRLVSMTIERGFPQVSRKDGRIYAQVVGEVDYKAGNLREIMAFAGRAAREIEARYPGIEIKGGASSADRSRSFGSILIAFLLGLIGVYMILSYQFSSYTLPVLVMLAIPFSAIGVIWGHFLIGVDLAMPSAIGFASLAGIVVNNAILFMIFFRAHLEQDGYEVAAINAVDYRFRPVLLSSMTTFVGLVPILFETSVQAQVLIPLVVSVAFGLLASSLLIIFVFPSVLCIYYDVAALLRKLGQYLLRMIRRRLIDHNPSNGMNG